MLLTMGGQMILDGSREMFCDTLSPLLSTFTFLDRRLIILRQRRHVDTKTQYLQSLYALWTCITSIGASASELQGYTVVLELIEVITRTWQCTLGENYQR